VNIQAFEIMLNLAGFVTYLQDSFYYTFLIAWQEKCDGWLLLLIYLKLFFKILTSIFLVRMIFSSF